MTLTEKRVEDLAKHLKSSVFCFAMVELLTSFHPHRPMRQSPYPLPNIHTHPCQHTTRARGTLVCADPRPTLPPPG